MDPDGVYVRYGTVNAYFFCYFNMCFYDQNHLQSVSFGCIIDCWELYGTQKEKPGLLSYVIFAIHKTYNKEIQNLKVTVF